MKAPSTIICIFLLLLFVACSSPMKKNSTVKGPVRGGAVKATWYMSPKKIAMERYQRMRGAGMDHNQALLMLRKHNRPAVRYSGEQTNAMRSEVQQNIAFYCFDYSKYGKFSTEAGCRKHATNIHQQCQIYGFGHYNRGVLACVKRLLKMR
ncbi:MAG: hypothetical protein KAG61_00035 [Bacteriovoracaceae bacterium]|nr:hypothetical protein [Bacteriovoracaceae bacterium]